MKFYNILSVFIKLISMKKILFRALRIAKLNFNYYKI